MDIFKVPSFCFALFCCFCIIKLPWNILVKNSWGHACSFLLGKHVSVELLGSKTDVNFNFWRYHQSFWVVVPFYNLSSVYENSNQCIIDIVHIFNFRHFSECVLISYCGFNMHFPNDWCWSSFTFFLTIYNSSFLKYHGLNSSLPPRIHTPISRNVTIFGDKIFKRVIKLKSSF